MTGLVFEGGGVKGAYQIGAYYALKKCKIKFDAIIGNSIGSFNAAMIVAGKERQLLKFWQKAEVGKILGLSDSFIEAMNNDSSIIEKIYHGTNEFIRILKQKGLDMNNLKKTLSSLVSEDEIRQSNINYGLDTVRVRDIKPLYLFKDDIPKGELLDYIVASCYLPIFKMEKLSDGEYYIDGGFYDKSPSNMLEFEGYDKIYIIALNGIGFTRKKINDSEIITISPSKNLGSTLNVNKKEINYNIKLGFYDTIKKLKNLDGYKYIFKKKKNAYYDHLIKKVSNKDLTHMQSFFLTQNNKELIIKALEYVLKHEKRDYIKIYNPTKEILKIKFINKDDSVYRFIKKLNII